MDNLLELLVPLIIAAIYFLGNMFSKKADEEESAPDPEAAERQRKIREEIRRRMMERQGGEQAAPQVEPPPPVQAPVHRAPPQRASPTPAQRPGSLRPKPAPTPAEIFDTPTVAYRDKVREQLAAIEATKKRAEAMKREARRKRIALEGEEAAPAVGVPDSLLGGPVIVKLRNPRAARAAFVYAEVLGRPIAMRTPENSPGSADLR